MRSVRADPRLATGIVLGVTIGAGIAFVLAGTLNSLLIRSADQIWWVGLDEEFGKLVAALILSVGVVKAGRSGVFIGVAVGLSFALWETACYYFGDYLGGMTGCRASCRSTHARLRT